MTRPVSILVVEDDRATREVLSLMIARKFPAHAVGIAQNGEEALKLFQEQARDLVVTDINMPDMDGIEMAGLIRSRHPEVRFIVVTAYGTPAFRERFDRIGFCDFIVKPIDFGRLFAAINKCIDDIAKAGAGRPA